MSARSRSMVAQCRAGQPSLNNSDKVTESPCSKLTGNVPVWFSEATNSNQIRKKLFRSPIKVPKTSNKSIQSHVSSQQPAVKKIITNGRKTNHQRRSDGFNGISPLPKPTGNAYSKGAETNKAGFTNGLGNTPSVPTAIQGVSSEGADANGTGITNGLSDTTLLPTPMQGISTSDNIIEERITVGLVNRPSLVTPMQGVSTDDADTNGEAITNGLGGTILLPTSRQGVLTSDNIIEERIILGLVNRPSLATPMQAVTSDGADTNEEGMQNRLSATPPVPTPKQGVLTGAYTNESTTGLGDTSPVVTPIQGVSSEGADTNGEAITNGLSDTTLLPTPMQGISTSDNIIEERITVGLVNRPSLVTPMQGVSTDDADTNGEAITNGLGGTILLPISRQGVLTSDNIIEERIILGLVNRPSLATPMQAVTSDGADTNEEGMQNRLSATPPVPTPKQGVLTGAYTNESTTGLGDTSPVVTPIQGVSSEGADTNGEGSANGLAFKPPVSLKEGVYAEGPTLVTMDLDLAAQNNNSLDTFEIFDSIDLFSESNDATDCETEKGPEHCLTLDISDIPILDPSMAIRGLINNNVEVIDMQEEQSVSPTAIPRSTSRLSTSSSTNRPSSSCSTPSTEQPPSPVASRKRLSQPSKWKINTAKKALNAGKAHVTPRKVERKAREMKPPCPDKCKKCKVRISEEDRRNVFDRFWSLADHTRQWDFILQHTSISSPVKKSEDARIQRKSSRKHFLTLGKKTVFVCKVMFLNTLGICDSWVETAVKKHLLSVNKSPISPSENPIKDERGKHNNRPMRTTEEAINYVKEHINSFPRVPSHYCRRTSKREYLEHSLSVAKMFDKYLLWAKNVKKLEEKQIVKIRQYRLIFNTKFNIGFHKPRKDQCSFCNRFKFSSRLEKEQLERKMARHILNKQQSRALKSDDKEEGHSNSQLCTVTFDLQKVLPCPRSDTSVFFYRNKLSLYDFTVYDNCSLIANCYMWDETRAKRGSNEIGSCLLLFIEAMVKEGKKEFRFYSDSCTGQNRNRFIFAMFLYAATKYEVKITHRFLEPGHTHMEVDNVHGRIEKATHMQHIFSPEEWHDAIKNAKCRGEMYRVIDVPQETIFNFKPLVELQKWDPVINKEKVKWGSVKEVIVDSQKPNMVSFRYDFESDPISFCVNKRGRPVNLATYKLPRAHYGNIPMKWKKVRDIKFLCEKGAIPSKYHELYSHILGEAVGAAKDPNWTGVENLEEVAYAAEEDLEMARNGIREMEDDDSEPEDGEDLEDDYVEEEDENEEDGGEEDEEGVDDLLD